MREILFGLSFCRLLSQNKQAFEPFCVWILWESEQTSVEPWSLKLVQSLPQPCWKSMQPPLGRNFMGEGSGDMGGGGGGGIVLAVWWC